MPSRTKQKNAEIAARSAALPKIPKELMDQIVAGSMTGEEVNAATLAFKKALIERVMGAELGHHLGQADAESNVTPERAVITSAFAGIEFESFPVGGDQEFLSNGSRSVFCPGRRNRECSPVKPRCARSSCHRMRAE